ncbi:MAG: aminotransferase class III-fold pyridoxal phosphate-dependent enzyme, partial [Myxococcota bacterium]
CVRDALHDVAATTQSNHAYSFVQVPPPTAPMAPAVTTSEQLNAKVLLDASQGVQAPFGSQPPDIVQAIQAGTFTGPALNNLTLSSWATPTLVRYMQLLRQVMPKTCKHLYVTSSQDEMLDKGLRCLRLKRPQAHVVIGFTHQYVGHTTAAARSLSEPVGDPHRFRWFTHWPHLPNPAVYGVEPSYQALQDTLKQHPHQQILGIVVELMGEKSGYTMPAPFLQHLAQVRERTGIPLIFVETASALGRMGETLFASDSCSVQPNMVLWYAGAQLGHVFVDHEHFASQPLMLISTWDGDEVSMLRTQHHLLAAQKVLQQGTANWFEQQMQSWELPKGVQRHGRGLWQVFDFGNQQQACVALQQAADAGILLSEGLPGRLVMAPPLNASRSQLQQTLEKLQQCWQ